MTTVANRTDENKRSANSAELVINVHTRAMLEAAFTSSAHALLLTGSVGSGLTTLAHYYANKSKTGAEVLTLFPEKDDKINLAEGTITTTLVRRLYTQTSTVIPEGRTVIIDKADTMTPSAQNAFLKLLEEPPLGTRFVLCSHDTSALLKTITSRTQHVDIRPITKKQSEDLLDTLGVRQAAKRAQLLFIANGLPAELTRLATDETRFLQRAQYIKDARSYITGSFYNKLRIAYEYKDNRAGALILLSDAMRLLRMSINKTNETTTLRHINRLEQISTRIVEQGNIRLQLSTGVSVV